MDNMILIELSPKAIVKIAKMLSDNGVSKANLNKLHGELMNNSTTEAKQAYFNALDEYQLFQPIFEAKPKRVSSKKVTE